MTKYKSSQHKDDIFNLAINYNPLSNAFTFIPMITHRNKTILMQSKCEVPFAWQVCLYLHVLDVFFLYSFLPLCRPCLTCITVPEKYLFPQYLYIPWCLFTCVTVSWPICLFLCVAVSWQRSWDRDHEQCGALYAPQGRMSLDGQAAEFAGVVWKYKIERFTTCSAIQQIQTFLEDFQRLINISLVILMLRIICKLKCYCQQLKIFSLHLLIWKKLK